MRAAQFRAMRETLGLSQEDVGDAVGVDCESVESWEAGVNPISDDVEEWLSCEKAVADYAVNSAIGNILALPDPPPRCRSPTIVPKRSTTNSGAVTAPSTSATPTRAGWPTHSKLRESTASSTTRANRRPWRRAPRTRGDDPEFPSQYCAPMPLPALRDDLRSSSSMAARTSSGMFERQLGPSSTPNEPWPGVLPFAIVPLSLHDSSAALCILAPVLTRPSARGWFSGARWLLVRKRR